MRPLLSLRFFIQRRWILSGIAVLALLTLSACEAPSNSQAAPSQAQTTPAAATKNNPQQSQAYTAKLQFTPPKAEVGKTIEVRGSDYPPNSQVELVWYTVQGRYELEGGTEFVGQRSDQISQVITAVRADPSGNIATHIQVPTDFGGAHDVRGRVDGKELSQASVTITPTFSMTPKEGSIGTPIELRIVGVDSQINVNTWHVLYDNRYLGFMGSVTTKGVAVARFRAAGPMGKRPVSVWHNSFNPTPYLNWQQGPYKDTPIAEFAFNVTSDPGLPTIAMDDFTAKDNPQPTKVDGPGKLALSVDRGQVGTPTTLRGSSLPMNTDLTLRWWRMVGNRVSATGFSEESKDFGAIRTGADGAFSKDFTIPDDLGGQHRIEALSGDKVLASTGLVIEPSVVSVTPTKVKNGDQVQIHLKGLGWTTYDNTYAVTYDNSYIGYVCGFSTNGDVQFNVTATGEKGTHIIDLYPTIYKGKDAMPRIYSVPQLTYSDDHPQRITPAIRMAVEITD